MKSLKDIEKISVEELMQVSSDGTVGTPEGFMERVDEELEALEKVGALTEEEELKNTQTFRRRIIGFVSAAAAVAVIAGLGFSLMGKEPKDTFDDPRLAYAELEEALATISDSITKGVKIADESQKTIEKATSKIFK